MIKKIRTVILGSGNLATNLAFAIKKANYEVVQIFGRTAPNVKLLAEGIGCPYTSSPADLDVNADLYFFAVSDNALEEVLSKLDLRGKLIIHCSGSTMMDVLKRHSDSFGVLYPLQTFSKNNIIDFIDVPVFLEASDKSSLEVLEVLASIIYGKVSVLDS